MNFTPAMNKEELMNGYQRIIQGIYSSKSYYQRVKLFLKNYRPEFKMRGKFDMTLIAAFIKSILYIGILKKNRKYYWDLLFWSLFNYPRSFPLAVTYSIYGYHFRKVFRELT
jgi:hypothetical protein